MPTAATLLQEVPLFKNLDDDERTLLATHVEEVSFAAGARIFSVGETGGSLYVVNQGLVELSFASSTGERILLETVGPGSFFGEMSLVNGQARSADAVVREDATLLHLDREDLRALFQKHPDAALHMLSVMGDRLRETDRTLRIASSGSPNQEVSERATPVQRLADALAAFSGSLSFLFLHIVWFLSWVLINTGEVPFVHPFDAYPYGLLTMMVSLEAIFLSCFMLISQNRQASRDRIRSEVEYAANIRAGLEVTQLHVKMDHLTELLGARGRDGALRP
jgi:uncharacterized membrane protein